MSFRGVAALAAVWLAFLSGAVAQTPEPIRVSQPGTSSPDRTLADLQESGMRMFTTRFTRPMGYGDGELDIVDTVSPGGRPSLQGNGMFLRVNGLDGQSCVECHSVVRADTVPPVFGIGGAGGSVTNAIIQPTEMDPADLADLDGNAGFNGRFANPPIVFGSGGVELVGLEMTAELHALALQAIENPGQPVRLVAKGVDFGTVVADSFGALDTSGVEGVDEDLVIKPFGRKGEFATVREFDIGALQFHFGMQPVEVVGPDFDADRDGVVNEATIDDLSALSAFVTSLERPFQARGSHAARAGARTFLEIGCADCHRPTLSTQEDTLPLRFPEIRTDPWANVFARVELTRKPSAFDKNPDGGIDVPLFSDLKRHDMGDRLAESFARATEKQNREFITAKLWGVADSAPYLHDGRATTIFEAIMYHGGEALEQRDAFRALDESRQQEILAFLGTLRNPVSTPPFGEAVGRDAGSRPVTQLGSE